MQHAALRHGNIAQAGPVGQLDRDHVSCVGDSHYIVGRFHAWKGKCHSALKLAFDGAPDAYLLYLPLSTTPGTRSGALRLSTAQAVGFLEDLAQFDELTPHEHSSYIGLSFAKSAMVQQVSELLDGPVTADLHFDRIVDLTTEKGLRLAALGHLVWSCLNLSDADRLAPAAIERLFESTMIALLEVVPNSYMPRLERPVSPAVPRQVKRAIEYMHANLSQPLTVASIASETGTSVRALQVAFQRFKGTTPLGYLKTIRLEAARRALVDDTGSRSIADAARSAGFTHMGRFAAVYYQAFGETPSETIRTR
ncbi:MULTISPECIES: helix-turn-helix transcriptional regulator [Rhizobium/Agrobacterium group]|uniref:AraC family transcriptional regulator n=5 Tax=Rhizobium/Agrobacterium group TaxID=227290 RepID=A0A2Z2PKV6_RHIRH|nr:MULTISPECIES: AraC family transcriptional regulator [Rhizobium/Agrobacterium group]ASK42105.1 AraC family transcriptional regulator [Rhizobium rhizogenes]AXO68556.1 AraC family transcriptional regulator [Rhizobium rhizogenes]MCZ7445653.1 AraC family transcriptional regulator [Rhizobium rhizogenes]MCZ7472517.1 AraC family transcriptional regulator [Rhizobium rhizogenes]MCZ7483893.1 AraC family transcriptional regulator [Rhizobium rhizogenes]